LGGASPLPLLGPSLPAAAEGPAGNPCGSQGWRRRGLLSSVARLRGGGAAQRGVVSPAPTTTTTVRRRARGSHGWIRLPPGRIYGARPWEPRGRRRFPCDSACRGGASLCVPCPDPPPPRSDPRCAATGAPVATAVASGDGLRRRRRLPVASDKRSGGLASRPRWRRGAMVAQPGPLAWHRGGGVAAGRWREVWHRGGACDNPPRKISYCRLKSIHFGH
jgi:hypothetical protein